MFDFALMKECQQELTDLIDDRVQVVDFENKCLASFVTDDEKIMITYFEVDASEGYLGAKDTLPSRRKKIVDKLLLIAKRA